MAAGGLSSFWLLTALARVVCSVVTYQPLGKEASMAKEKTIHGSNDVLLVTREHTSKRGKVYKRTRKVTANIEVPGWWRR